jgi:hypothetical protein
MELRFIAKPGRPIFKVLLLLNIIFIVFHFLALRKGGFPIFTVLILNILIILISKSNRIESVSFLEGVFLIESTNFGIKKSLDFPYAKINYSYSEELIGRGKVEKTLIIRDGEERIAFLSPSTTGFSKDEIIRMKEILEEKGVQEIA